jgi:DNA modification methylase
MDYGKFLYSKRHVSADCGHEPSALHSSLYDFQRAITQWAIRRGRAAIFAGTGLGKTRMQIEWARPIWYGIRESETLNAAAARSEKDERHICPLQLETIERCVRLWSNPGELVFSPFAGIGSEGYVSLQHGRKFIGIELKREYYEAACRNLRGAVKQQAFGFLASQ